MCSLIPQFREFCLGNIRYDHPLIQAPLDGFSDSPFRRITRELGSPVSYTEFINGLDVIHKTPNLPLRIAFEETERPIAFQLFDDDPQRIIDSAAILEEKCHPDFFDVNMGCSAKRVANRGAGAGLMKHPDKIQAIVEGLVKRVKVPITVKIRLGWDETSQNYLDIGKIAEDYGAAMVTLHARTKAQQYQGFAHWEAIADLKKHISIPVIGNGDVSTIADARRMMSETGCDAVMIGRAGIINPWIFAGYDTDAVPDELYRRTCRDHLKYIKDFYGPQRGCIIFRKYAVRYLGHLSIPREDIRKLVTTNDPNLFSEMFDRYMALS